ncbi:MAG: hypothetical protein PUC06_04205 [Oscillospiraceae bacterium]|nr:hypothetical protein [Oscillospiraceae bacterium]
MITDTELLSYIRQTALMGHDGIDTVLKYASCRPLADALRQQKAEYGEICESATKMLRERGRTPEPLAMGSKMGLAMSRTMSVFSPPSTSRIAEQMINGNTKGAIKSIQHHRQYLGKDERVTDLSKKLLETEENNIRQMKPFL